MAEILLPRPGVRMGKGAHRLRDIGEAVQAGGGKLPVEPERGHDLRLEGRHFHWWDAVGQFAEQRDDSSYQRAFRVHPPAANTVFHTPDQPHAGHTARHAMRIAALLRWRCGPLATARGDCPEALVRVFDEEQATDKVLLFFREGHGG